MTLFSRQQPLAAGIILTATVLAGTALITFAGSRIDSVKPAAGARTRASLHGYFVPNAGQFPANVALAASASRGSVWVTHDGDVVTQLAAGERRATIVEHPVGPGPAPAAVGANPRAFQASYFTSRGSASRLSVFDAVDLGERWPNIDVSLRIGADGAERLFKVAPGGRTDDIRIAADGPMQLLPDGRLEVKTSVGSAFLTRPIAYQDGGRPVEVAFALHGDQYGFVVGDYDTTRPLTIDPILHSTYLGGSKTDTTFFTGGVAVNSAGEVLVTAYATPEGFPETGAEFGTFDEADVMVARLSADLSDVLSVAFFGGSGIDYTQGIVVGAGDVVYVGGVTYSVDLPGTAGGYQPANATTSTDKVDGFMALFSADLTQLTQATYYGTSVEDYFFGGIALAADGDVLLVGSSTAMSLPGSAGAAQAVNAGGRDAVVVKFAPALTSVTRATFYGTGLEVEGAQGIAADATGVFVLLGANSAGNGLPSVAKLAPDLGSVLATRALATAGENYAAAITVAPGGDVYAVGQSRNGEVVGTADGAQPAPVIDSYDCFIARMPSDLSAITQATYIASEAFEACQSVAASATAVYVGGSSASQDFPAIDGGAQTVPSAPFSDLFVMQLDLGLTTFEQATYLGADGTDEGARLAVAGNGDLLVLGTATGDGLPGADGYQTTFGGLGDLFLVRLDSLSAPAGSDTVPDAYDFTDLSGRPPNSQAVSDPVTVSGINAPTLMNAYDPATNLPIETSINGGPYVTGRRPVANDDQVRLRVLSSGVAGGFVTANISIGGVLDTWTVVTASGDDSPSAFNFRDARVPSSPPLRVTSAPVTISGITVPVLIELLNADAPPDGANRAYTINGGSERVGAGVVNPGDQVRLVVNAPTVDGQSVTVTVKIGNRTDSWKVTAGYGGGGPVPPASLVVMAVAALLRTRRRQRVLSRPTPWGE
jgi:hypothetical protein